MSVKEVNKIVGANQKNKRQKNDFYPTPAEVTGALLDFLQMPVGARIWEPACGQNHMVDVMRGNGYYVIGTDIQDGVDFLTSDLPEGIDWIITNPPFNAAEAFIERCIEHGKCFALLLKSQYWHSSKRSRLFMRFPPSYVLPLTWRPAFTGQGSSLMDMMWCVWTLDNGKSYSLYKPLLKPKSKE